MTGPQIVPGRVSVVIPAFDAARVLGAAISGGLTQTYPDVEVVVVDDGSSDGTAEVAGAYDDRVVVVRQANAGPSSARNAGVRVASGEYIAFCDADDALLPHHVSAALEELRGAPAQSYVCSDALLLDDAGVDPARRVLYYDTPADDDQLSALLAINIVSMFPVFPRAMWDAVGGLDEQMAHCEDWDFWLRAGLAGWRVRYQRRPSALYRRTAGSLSSDAARMAAGHRTVLIKALEQSAAPLSTSLRLEVQARLAGPSVLELVPRADALLATGQVREALRLYRQAVRLNPADSRLRRKVLVLMLLPASVVRLAKRRRGSSTAARQR